MERKNPVAQIFIYVFAVLLAAVILAPLVWLFVMSISPAADLSAKPLRWWPETIDFFALSNPFRDRREFDGRGLHGVAQKLADGRRHCHGRGCLAGCTCWLGRLAHAENRLVAVAGHRYLHVAASCAGRAALYGLVPSRPFEHCLRPCHGLSDHSRAVHNLADEIGLRHHSARHRTGRDDRWGESVPDAQDTHPAACHTVRRDGGTVRLSARLGRVFSMRCCSPPTSAPRP